jgi:hypothetical protein
VVLVILAVAAFSVRLGRALQRARDRVFGQLRIVVGGTDRDSRTLYALQRVEPEGSPTSPCEARPVEVELQDR